MTNTATCVVVLLRAVNLGSTNKVPMASFRDLLAGLGAREVVTYLQSGQAVVDLHPGRVPGFAERVHDAIADELGLDLTVVTRTAEELAAVAAANPFPHLVATPKRLHVSFLDGDPDPNRVEAIGQRHGDDEFAVGDRVLYLAFAGSSRDSPLNSRLGRLGVVGTARNWTTVTKLVEISAGREAVSGPDRR